MSPVRRNLASPGLGGHAVEQDALVLQQTVIDIVPDQLVGEAVAREVIGAPHADELLGQQRLQALQDLDGAFGGQGLELLHGGKAGIEGDVLQQGALLRGEVHQAALDHARGLGGELVPLAAVLQFL